MKIRFILLLILVFAISTTTLGKELDYNLTTADNCTKISEFVKFKSVPSPIVKDGLKIQIVKPIGAAGINGFSLNLDQKTFFASSEYYIGVAGVYISITNETNDVVKIIWRDSVIYVNNINYGMPFFWGEMSYIDAGNPSAIQNTIIPSQKTVIVKPCVPTLEIAGRVRYLKPVPLLRTLFIKFSYYINVDINGQSSYINIETPDIYLPPISETMPEKAK